jgi:hypothetical protein
MDSLKDTVSSFTGSSDTKQDQPADRTQNQHPGGMFGGVGDKLNSLAGGGRESEKKEDYLDKGGSPLLPASMLRLFLVWSLESSELAYGSARVKLFSCSAGDLGSVLIFKQA